MNKLIPFVLVVVILLYGIAIAEETNRFEIYSGVYVAGESLPVGGYLMTKENASNTAFHVYDNIDKYLDNKYNDIDGGSIGDGRFINLKDGYVLYLEISRSNAEKEKGVSAHVYLEPMNFKVVVE